MGKDLEMLRELSLAEQLGRLHRLWRTVADLELAPLGLTHPRWTALWKLSRLGGHLSQKTLAEALEIELPSLMRTLGQLEEQGLIERHCCSQDKRARIVTLTPAGACAAACPATPGGMGGGAATLMPTPITAWRWRPWVQISMRMPPSLRWRYHRSLGHFTRSSCRCCRSSACARL